MFKKSPLKTACLEKYVKEELGKEVKLILDVRTRWNSMVGMIEAFLKTKNSIKKTLIDFGSTNLWIEEHIPLLEALVEVLNPIKDAVEALSRRDSNLLIADAIMNTLYEQLVSTNSSLSRKMVDTIKNKMNDRRDNNMLSLLNYLKDCEYIKNHSNTFKNSLKIFAEQMFKRLFGQCDIEISSSSDDDDDIFEIQSDQTFKNKLINAINNAKAAPKIATAENKNLFKKELALFETSKTRTKNLDILYNALLTIKPTSVESERVFSVAGNFATKIRNRMSNELLNALIILKTTFLKT